MSKLTYIVTFGGSGTHLLQDALGALGIHEGHFNGLIIDALIRRKHKLKFPDAKELTPVHDREDRLLYSDLASICEKVDEEVFAGSLMRRVARYLKAKKLPDTYFLHPHIHYETKFEKEGAQRAWTEPDLDLFLSLIKGASAEAGYRYSEMLYLRNPIDIFISKFRRFGIDNPNQFIQSETARLTAFSERIAGHGGPVAKFEDLVADFEKQLKWISEHLTDGELDFSQALKITITQSPAKRAMSMHRDERALVSSLLKKNLLPAFNGHYTENSIESSTVIGRLKNRVASVLDEFRHLNDQLLLGKFQSDGALARHRWSVPARIYRRVLLLFPKCAHNHRLFVKNREARFAQFEHRK